MKIELTGDQLTEAMTDYLKHGNVSALLNRVARAMDAHAANMADREPGEASWVGYAAGRMRVTAYVERCAEDDMFTDLANSMIGDVASVTEADPIVGRFLAARGL